MYIRYTVLLCILTFICGLGIGRTIHVDQQHSEIESVYSILERQADNMTIIIGTQQIQLHYLVPHRPGQGNPFCPVCRKLGWSSNADLE